MTHYTVVTSLNKSYLNDTAKLNLESWVRNLQPDNTSIVAYSEEDLRYKNTDITFRDLYQEAPKLVEFKEKFKDDPMFNGKIGTKVEGTTKAFKWKGIKFAHKTYAVFSEAKKLNSGWLIWLDADVLMHEPLKDKFFEKHFPKDKSVVYLGRPESYDECGLMGFNLDRPFARKFLEKFEQEYNNGLQGYRETHDSWIFYQLRLSYSDQSEFHDLNPTPENNKSPFNNSGLKEFMVHTKGKNKEKLQRKFLKRFELQRMRDLKASRNT
jgi:hypothetical protein